MTRLRTYNKRAKVKALSRRQITARGQARLFRLVRKMFRHQRAGMLKIGSNFRDLTFATRNLGKAMNSFHLQQNYGSPTGRLSDHFHVPNHEPRMHREGHTPPPTVFLETDFSKIEERVLSTYGAGDVNVAKVTGQYPNVPIKGKK